MCFKCGCATAYYVFQAAIAVILPFVLISVHKEPGSSSFLDQQWTKKLFFSHGLFFVAGILVLVTLPLALLGITQHWFHCDKPYLQKPIQRILWIVPIWTVTSWISLWLPDYAITLDTCRECYEAYAIFQFLILMHNHMSYELDLDEEFKRQPPVPHLLFFKHIFTPWYKGRIMAKHCTYGILQYAVVRIITLIIALNCEIKNVYNRAIHVLLLLNMSSKGIVVYCLIFFYLAHVIELKPMKPLPKLMCIKFLVFFSFIINATMLILHQTDSIPKIIDIRTDELHAAYNFHDILICAEMFVAVIAFQCIFNYRNYASNVNGQQFESLHNTRDSTEKQEPSTNLPLIEDVDEPLLSSIY